MRSYVLISGFVGAMMLMTATAANAQRAYKARPFDPNASTQMSVDVSQFDPNVQIGKILKNTEMLLQQVQQLQQRLDDTQKQLDLIEGRGKATALYMNSGTGESVGPMITEIRDRVRKLDN